jgi:hypothetical protein
MAIIKPEQLSSGSYNISGSFSGSFQGDGSGLNNLPIPLIETGSFVTTSSFDAFTSSYIQDSSSFDTRILNNNSSTNTLSGSFTDFSGSYIQDSASFNIHILANSSSIEILSSSFESFTQTYNTGSFSGSFFGDGSALTGISYERLSDFQFPYHYSGNATLGTSTSSTGWIINRIDFTTPGSPITLQGTGSWDNRTSLIYS